MSENSISSSASIVSSPRKRGILYVKWGPGDALLRRSMNAVRAIHPELPIHVHELPDASTLLDKAAMMNFTPFEETLFLDLDTVVLSPLDFGFEMAIRHGLACCISECPWACRNNGIKGDLVEYNTGVLFFTKKARPIFDRWNENARTIDSSIRFFDERNELSRMPCNDQAGFSVAIAESPTLPFILPFNWNFRPRWQRSWWGPIKIWHEASDPPQEVIDYTRAQSQPDSVIQYLCFKS